jgi:hypothetical protein
MNETDERMASWARGWNAGWVAGISFREAAAKIATKQEGYTTTGTVSIVESRVEAKQVKMTDGVTLILHNEPLPEDIEQYRDSDGRIITFVPCKGGRQIFVDGFRVDKLDPSVKLTRIKNQSTPVLIANEIACAVPPEPKQETWRDREPLL